MSSNDSSLSDAERTVYGARADVLIPGAEGMPSATQVGTHTSWIDEALVARPDLVVDFKASLHIGPADDPAAAIAELHRTQPLLFDAFSILTSGAYLMCPDVKQIIGYPGQEERPVTGDDVPDYIDMLENVAARGPVYRPTVLS
jgi:hypothetical protein